MSYDYSKYVLNRPVEQLVEIEEAKQARIALHQTDGSFLIHGDVLPSVLDSTKYDIDNDSRLEFTEFDAHLISASEIMKRIVAVKTLPDGTKSTSDVYIKRKDYFKGNKGIRPCDEISNFISGYKAANPDIKIEQSWVVKFLVAVNVKEAYFYASQNTKKPVIVENLSIDSILLSMGGQQFGEYRDVGNHPGFATQFSNEMKKLRTAMTAAPNVPPVVFPFKFSLSETKDYKLYNSKKTEKDTFLYSVLFNFVGGKPACPEALDKLYKPSETDPEKLQFEVLKKEQDDYITSLLTEQNAYDRLVTDNGKPFVAISGSDTATAPAQTMDIAATAVEANELLGAID